MPKISRRDIFHDAGDLGAKEDEGDEEKAFAIHALSAGIHFARARSQFLSPHWRLGTAQDLDRQG